MRTTLLLASAALLLTGGAASAQTYGQPYGQSYGQPYGGGYGQPYANPAARTPQPGQRLPPQLRTPAREVADYFRYRLTTPPRGYAYYRTETGDIVLAQRSSGVIASVYPNAVGQDPRAYGYQGEGRDAHPDWGADGDYGYRDTARGQPGWQPYWQRAQPTPNYYPDHGANDPDNSYYGGYGEAYSQPSTPSYGYSQPSSRQGQVFTAPSGRRYTVGPDGVSRWVD